MIDPPAIIWRLLCIGCCLISIQAADIAVVRMAKPPFEDAVAGLRSGLEPTHTVHDLQITNAFTYADLKKHVLRLKPHVLLVMDNPAILHAQQLFNEDDPYLKNLPIIAGMGLNLQHQIRNHPNIAGINYEVPPFSVINSFKQITGEKPKKVITFYRKDKFATLIEDATRQLARDDIELVAIDVQQHGESANDIHAFLRRNLKRYCLDRTVDAVLILPDNSILTARNISTWRQTAKRARAPFLTGINLFVDARQSFCTFAASPDHQQLGQQLADMAINIIEDGAKPSELGVEYILGINERIDARQANRLGLTIEDSSRDTLEVSR